jgi:phage tail sheath protein FI
MPEYLAPGVFVEEVSFRSKSIEGVSTGTAGMVGPTRYGPICFPGGPRNCEPRLITSFTDFERVYGGLEELLVGDDAPSTTHRLGYLAHAVRAFFENGGKRVYISRIFIPRGVAPAPPDWGAASLDLGTVDVNPARWRARWPGAAGNVHVTTETVRSKNVALVVGGAVQVPRARVGAVVEVLNPPPPGTPLPIGNDPLTAGDLRVVQIDPDGNKTFIDSGGVDSPPTPGQIVQLVELAVTVVVDAERTDVYTELAASPDQTRYIGRILEQADPEDQDAVVWLDWEPGADAFGPALLMSALQTTSGRLTNGHDGRTPQGIDFAGEEASPDDPEQKATGLAALGEIDDIAVVAAPDAGTLATDTDITTATQALISHAERLRFRIAIVDGPQGSSLSEIRDFRGQFDSKYAALYHPYVEIQNPLERPAQGAPPKLLQLPPSGFLAGIYARSDIERGVHKAPANETVRGMVRFEATINTPRNEVINPEGINALRYFDGRGYRVWGARTMSSDPEWKYVNVRRLFIFVEHSIRNGTHWAVFEPNNSRLWTNIRHTVEDFLLVLWRDGMLLGSKPEEAFFVRCDRTTMTQNDLDNGRLICLVGMAPVKPAEFVIFRVGQWTADAQLS